MNEVIKPCGIVPVTAAGFATPELLRDRLEMAEGLNLLEIVRAALPLLHEKDYRHLRLTLVSAKGMTVIPQTNWAKVYPHAGTHVVIRLIPGKDALRTILQILVTVAATALAAPWAGTLFGSLLTAGLTALGGFLINLLIPQESADKNKEKPGYSISGWENRANPDGPVPSLAGQMRYAPQPIVRWTEIVGDDQYVRAWFNFGYGRVEITDLKIGDTPFAKFDEIEWELREGLDTDAPFSLITQQIYEDANIARVLERPLPRGDDGEVVAGAAEEKPVSVYTASGGFRHGFVLSCPQGMTKISAKGHPLWRSVTVAVRRRLNGLGAWEALDDVTVTARKTSAIFRQVFFDVPTVGRWEYEFTRMTDESAAESIRDQVVLSAIQTFRHEYPVNFGKPLAGLQMRIRATHQLNGTLRSVNGIARRWLKDWDSVSGTWIERFSNNPASIFRNALQGPEASKPFADAQVDLIALQHWHEVCALKGWTYNRVHDFEASWFDTLRQIAAAGMASPHMDGKKWTVIIDEPQSLVTAHLNPLNSRGSRWETPYLELPDAVRVRFQDETNDWQPAERLIPWIGHEGEIGLTEEWSFPGKTNPSEIWLLAMRRMMEVDKRRKTYTLIQDGDIRTAVRGDLVMAIIERLDDSQRAARVVSVSGNLVVLNDAVTMAEGVTYGLRLRSFGDDNDGMGVSVLRPIVQRPGEASAVLLAGTGALPSVSDIVHVGPLTADSKALRVKKIERGEKGAQLLTLTEAAPEIDADVALLTPPSWTPAVGTDIGGSGAVPAVPEVVSLTSGVSTGGAANSITLILKPGAGSAALVGSYDIYHRLTGAPSWTGPVTITAAAAGKEITSYAVGNSVELQARAVSVDGVAGALTATKTIVVGAVDAGAAGSFVSVSMTGSLGHISGSFVTGANQRTVVFYLQHAIGGSLDRAADIVRTLDVEPGQYYEFTFGDATRVNLMANGNFNAAGATTYESGWSFSTDKAAKTAGVANWVFEALTLTAGIVYRTRMKVARTAGSVQIGLKGSADVTGTARSAAGTYYQALAGVAGLTGGGAKSDASFAGSVDDLVIYAQTSACLSQGGKTLWLEPFNADGVAGPLSAALEDTVI